MKSHQQFLKRTIDANPKIKIVFNCFLKLNIDMHPNTIKQFIILIYPFTPHVACEIWEKITNQNDLHLQKWPSYKEDLLKREQNNIVIQINGKKRAILLAKDGEDENSLFQMSLELDNVKKLIKNKKIIKKVYVKNKLINFVINE